MPLLRDGSIVEDPRLDRIFEGDVRNRDFPVTARLGADQTKPKTTMWPISVTLDQGQEGSCVGHGFAHEALAEPVPVPGITHQYAKEVIYWTTQREDPWPGGSYPGATPFYEGTSVLTGAKVMTKLGFYTGYHWAFSEPEVALAISYLGPVVIGVNWYSGMYKPDYYGNLRPSGDLVGGHCVLLRGYNASTKSYTVHNSWGAGWGVNGDAKLTAASLGKLLAQKGDACVPEGRKLVTV